MASMEPAEFQYVYDPKVAQEVIEDNPRMFQYGNINIRRNLKLINLTIPKAPDMLPYVGDLRIIEHTVNKYPTYLQYAGPICQNNPNLVCRVLEQKPELMQFVGELLKENVSFLEKVMKETKARVFQYMSFTHRSDLELAKLAVSMDPKQIQWVGQELLENEEIWMIIIRKHPDWYAHKIPNSLRKNRAIALEAVKGSENNFQHVDPGLRDDEEVVLAAVEKDGLNLRYAGEAMRNNPQVVMTAFEQTKYSIDYAGDTIKENKSVMLKVVERDGRSLVQASQSLKNDPDVSCSLPGSTVGGTA